MSRVTGLLRIAPALWLGASLFVCFFLITSYVWQEYHPLSEGHSSCGSNSSFLNFRASSFLFFTCACCSEDRKYVNGFSPTCILIVLGGRDSVGRESVSMPRSSSWSISRY